MLTNSDIDLQADCPQGSSWHGETPRSCNWPSDVWHWAAVLSPIRWLQHAAFGCGQGATLPYAVVSTALCARRQPRAYACSHLRAPWLQLAACPEQDAIMQSAAPRLR